MNHVTLLCYSETVPHLILPAAGFSEVSHWRKLSMNWQTIEPTVVQLLNSFLSILFIAKLDSGVCVCVCMCVCVYVCG